MTIDFEEFGDIDKLEFEEMENQQIEDLTTTLAQLRPGPYQKRETFDPEPMKELALSIDSAGIINPPIVFQENGYFPLLAGERRWRQPAPWLLAR